MMTPDLTDATLRRLWQAECGTGGMVGWL